MIFYTFWVVRAICWGTAFSMRKVRFCGQTINPLPHAAPPGHVTQLKPVSGRRWIAHCPPTLWSSFWMASSDPDDKPGGKGLPAAASGPLADGQALGFPAWVLSRCVACFFCPGTAACLCRAFSREVVLDQKHWQVLIKEGDLMLFPLGLYFTQRRVDPKAYMNIGSGPSPWRLRMLSSGTGREV